MAEAGIRARFARAVREERKARGWTQTQLAEKAGISLATVLNTEKQRSSPRLDAAAAIAEALGLPLGALTDGEVPRG